MASTYMSRIFACLAFTILMTVSALGVSAAPEFCWKDSYGRGVGTVPQGCAPGQDRIGLLCYNKCPAGMQRFGFDCHSVCPAGWRNDGLFCRRAEYGRGVGYPWKFGDALNDNGMRGRCERDHGRGNCEKNGLIFYPKCKPGYSNFGCCICRPAVPNCNSFGLNAGIDLSCAKRIQIGSPKTGVCGSGQEKDAGLCYKNCRAGYDGVGPVCWADKPAGWVNCGMGNAKDSKTCASIVFGQVSSVGQMAIFVASLGSSSGATAAANTAKSATKLAKLKKQFETMKKAFDAIKNTPQVQKAITAAKAAGKVKKGYTAAQTAANATTPEDMARVAAQIAAILDPTGVSSTVAAYTYPTCSKYFGTATATPTPAVVPAGLPTGSFAATLQASHSSKCLDGTSPANGSNVHQWQCHGGSNQNLTFTPVSGKTDVYSLKFQHSNRCLDVAGGNGNNGGNFHHWDCHGQANQQFKVESVGGDLYKLTAQHSGRVVDVRGPSSDNGANIHQWEYVGGANQKWKIAVK